MIALSHEQTELGERARQIARDVLRPVAAAGTPGRVNRALVRALAEQGLLPRLFPHQAGGTHAGALSALDLCLLREALARESTEAENALAIQALGAHPIVQAGPPPLVKRWIPAVASGKAVAAFALTEPQAGSDAASLALRAEPDGDGFRLSGEKAFISNAPDADVYTVFARTSPEAGARGITAFAVAGDAAGLSGSALTLVSTHPIGNLRFEGVRAERAQVLGEVDQGFRLAMQTLDLFRPSVGAMVVGMAESALDAATRHAASRRQFGRPIREFQAVSHQLADMATRIEAARLLVYSAAAAYDGGAPRVRRRSAMAKLFATETAQFVVDAAIQIHGAAALEQGHLLEHLYREVRAPRIYEGTSEIQREIIARDLFRQD
ncbi:MAG TPA: acyl-CoA dehydrogenase family protein [Candidatus Limnocylindrales bacterium]|nr:acyl-CoA dehydrogenase family protein [Candidatus Limnocylindrales bacterium]